MGRFLAIVIALVAIALVINKYQSREKPAVEDEPKLIAPEKLETPAEKPKEVAAEGEKAIEVELEAVDPAVEQSPAAGVPQAEEAAPSKDVKDAD